MADIISYRDEARFKVRCRKCSAPFFVHAVYSPRSISPLKEFEIHGTHKCTADIVQKEVEKAELIMCPKITIVESIERWQKEGKI